MTYYREVGLDPCSHSVGPTGRDETPTCLDCGAEYLWVVPVEPCKHGNYAEHIVSVQVWAGVPTWCPGAGIGDTE